MSYKLFTKKNICGYKKRLHIVDNPSSCSSFHNHNQSLYLGPWAFFFVCFILPMTMDLKTAVVFLEWLLNWIEFITVHMADLATSKQKLAI